MAGHFSLRTSPRTSSTADRDQRDGHRQRPVDSLASKGLRTLPASRNRHNALRTRWDIPSVDQIMVEERAAAFTKRSIKTSAKLAGLKLAISVMDLTTLEGKDTPGKVAFLCRKAMQPAHPRYDAPPRGLSPASRCGGPARVLPSTQISSGPRNVSSALRESKWPPSRRRFRP